MHRTGRAGAGHWAAGAGAGAGAEGRERGQGRGHGAGTATSTGTRSGQGQGQGQRREGGGARPGPPAYADDVDLRRGEADCDAAIWWHIWQRGSGHGPLPSVPEARQQHADTRIARWCVEIHADLVCDGGRRRGKGTAADRHDTERQRHGGHGRHANGSGKPGAACAARWAGREKHEHVPSPACEHSLSSDI